MATGAEPTILSCLGEEPVFHVVGIASFDMGGQGREYAVGILGMKPGSPTLQNIGEFLGKGTTNWQVLSESSRDFESSVITACELVVKGDPRIGTIPKKKGKKK